MNRIPWHKLLIDLVVILAVGILFLVLKFVIHPSKTGFYCNDYSVNMPFKNSTVSSFLLFIISFLVPCLFIVANEVGRGLYAVVKKGVSSAGSTINKYRIVLPNRREIQISESVGNIFVNLLYFSFGHLCNSSITLIGKKTIGRLRPNFLDVCKPAQNPYTTYCNTAVTGKTYLIPDLDFNCLASVYNPQEVEESRKSFPSGHSSSIFYGMIFLCIYVHRVWSKPTLGLIPNAMQVIFLGTAVFVALSRVLDNKHHPSDVLAGSTIGIVISTVTGYYLNLFFKRFAYRNKYDPVSHGTTISSTYELRNDNNGGGESELSENEPANKNVSPNSSSNNPNLVKAF